MTAITTAPRLGAISRAFETIGRALIQISFEPLLFSIGVFMLFANDRLSANVLGGGALTGA